MAMAQTAFRARPTSYRYRTASASQAQRAEMLLFQAFLRPFSAKVTDGHCIKDATTIDPVCGSGNFLTETYIRSKMDNFVKGQKNNGGNFFKLPPLCAVFCFYFVIIEKLYYYILKYSSSQSRCEWF